MSDDYLTQILLGVIIVVILFATFMIRPTYMVNDSLNVSVSESGTGADFYLNVAEGKVDGYSAINKFGHNPTANSGDDVWSGDGVYEFFPTTPQSLDVVSTSPLDTDGGTGARTLVVTGLNGSWHEVSEYITLNGTTEVNLQNTYRRMYRAMVLTAGSVETNAGDISVEIQGDTTIAVFIGDGDGQTQQAIYTIPVNKTGYFVKGYVGLADDDKNGETASFQWQMRFNNGVIGAWAVQGEMGLNNIGSSNWQYQYGIPAGGIPSKTDIRIRVVDSTAILGVVGGFDILLVDD